jgi:hypothetical protein
VSTCRHVMNQLSTETPRTERLLHREVGAHRGRSRSRLRAWEVGVVFFLFFSSELSSLTCGDARGGVWIKG